MVRRGGQHDLTVRKGDVSLAGSLWLPAGDVVATLLMHPGSGPSDRDNDVCFPPIHTHLLEAGIAVASFDKRGVGGSTGKWEEASIVVQADDALACVDTLAGESNLGTPVGLFGHSQGGWVVLDAAARGSDVAFVISNSGPGVTPGEQERWAARSYAQRAGISEILEVDRFFDFLVSMLRSHAPFEQVHPLLAAEGFPGLFDSLGLHFLPEDAAVWEFMAATSTTTLNPLSRGSTYRYWRYSVGTTPSCRWLRASRSTARRCDRTCCISRSSRCRPPD